mmetsp:Transcript_26417/g.37192  ORF Transcript_26417/g.37192 Transcript_26417/m.37192 type:complete len:683 (-) Transcript_26417:42-2090(-)
MDLEKRVQRLQGNFQPGLEGKGSFGYGTFLPMVDSGSKIPSKRSREHNSQTTNSHIINSQVRNNQPSHTSVSADPANDDMASQIPKSSTETSSPSRIIQVMTIPLGPLLSPFVSVPNSVENQASEQKTSTIEEENKPVVQQVELVVQPEAEVMNLEKIEDHPPEHEQLTSEVQHMKTVPESETQQLQPKQDENKEAEKPIKSSKDRKEAENGVSSKSQTPEMQNPKDKREKSIQESTSNETAKDRKTKSDKYRADEKKSKEREESKEKKDKKSKDSQRSKEKKKKSPEKELDKKKDRRDQLRTRSSSRSSSRSRSRERDRGRNYDRDRDYKEKRRRRSYSYSSDNGNSSSPSRSRYSSSDSDRDYDRKRRRKGKSRSRSRDRKERDKDRKDRDRSKNKKRKRESRDRSTLKNVEDSKKLSKPGIAEILTTETANLSAISAKDASVIAEECKKNATKLKHVADKLSDKSQAGEIYFQSGLQFLACAHAYEEGNMHDKAVMMYQQTGIFFESIAKMYSHDDKFKVLVSMCCKCVAVALSRRFILDPSRLRQLHADLTMLGSTSNSGVNNTGVPNSPPSSSSSTSTQGNNLDPSPPQPVSTSPSLPPSNTERSSSSSNTQSQPTVRLKGEKQQNLFDMIKCFEMWGRAEKNLAIQHYSMTNVKELIQSLTQYAKTNLATSSSTDS